MLNKRMLILVRFLVIFLTWDTLAARQGHIAVTEKTFRPVIPWHVEQVMGASPEAVVAGPHEVIVAVIDSGVDINHQDFKGRIWVNTREIPGNNIDDDYNGYVDDVAGWNFIGAPNGHAKYQVVDEVPIILSHQRALQVEFDTLAVTRELIRQIKNNKIDKKLQALIQQKRTRAKDLLKAYQEQKSIMLKACEELTLSCQTLTLNQLENLSTQSESALLAKSYLMDQLQYGQTFQFVSDEIHDFRIQLDYHYNLEHTERLRLVGDSPSQFIQPGYGNNDVIGPNPGHGTHVAGIIAARNNPSTGAFGIAKNVKIMPLRVVPEGDERDKDVANAILYAVNNGAQVINLSFGKYYSSSPKLVWRAMQVAERKGIPIIIAAGNEATNIDEKDYYPSAKYASEILSNVIMVGAGNHRGELSNFSNRGRQTVKFLAPGERIYSTYTDNKYLSLSGTSMAAPIISAVVANLLSHAPSLDPISIQHLLQSTLRPIPDGSAIPYEQVQFPGIINLSAALEKLQN